MANFEKITFTPGQILFRQGESSTDLFFIHSGRIGISISQPYGDFLLHELTTGMLIGEMGFLSGPPRTVTATALEESTVSLIPAAKFRQSLLGLPEWSLSIARALADRLKNTANAFERLVQEKSHSVAFASDEPESVNLSPASLEIAYYPESDLQRLHLAGSIAIGDLPRLMGKVEELRERKVSPVILNCASVTDIEPAALEKMITSAKASNSSAGVIQLENVQFISERFREHDGYEQILHSESAPIRRVGFEEHLIRQGEKGTEMFVVKTGSFKVYRQTKNGELVLFRAKEGDVIGELALITGMVRSASVKAERSSQVYVISIDDFRKNSYHIPHWFMPMIEGLAVRLRSLNETLENFLSGQVKPAPLSLFGPLIVTENFRVSGECYLRGSLSMATLKELQVYISLRLKLGVRRFHFDLTGLDSADPRALKYFVKFQEYLLEFMASSR